MGRHSRFLCPSTHPPFLLYQTFDKGGRVCQLREQSSPPSPSAMHTPFAQNYALFQPLTSEPASIKTAPCHHLLQPPGKSKWDHWRTHCSGWVSAITDRGSLIICSATRRGNSTKHSEALSHTYLKRSRYFILSSMIRHASWGEACRASSMACTNPSRPGDSVENILFSPSFSAALADVLPAVVVDGLQGWPTRFDPRVQYPPFWWSQISRVEALGWHPE